MRKIKTTKKVIIRLSFILCRSRAQQSTEEDYKLYPHVKTETKEIANMR